MTAEQLPPSAPEIRDIRTSDEFLRQLFDRSLVLIRKKDAEAVARFGHGDTMRWDGYGARDVEKGLILRNQTHDFALVLGKVPGRQNNITDFEFGQAFHAGKDTNFSIRYLSSIVHQTLATYGSGRFYSSHGILSIDCWPDSPRFGGDNVNGQAQERILSKGGLEASVFLVQQVLERSW